MSHQLSSDPPVKSVDTTLRIVEAVRDKNGAQLGEISEELGLATSTVSDHLVTLHQNGYLVKSGDEYRVGLRFLELGDQARSNEQVYQLGRDKIDTLAEKTDELVHLSVEQDGLGIIIYERGGSEAVSLDTYVGRHVEMHCTALGKAMLAYFSDEYVDQIIEEHGLERKTDQTIVDEKELLTELEEIRDRGYATSYGERIPGLGCVAVPIRHTTDGTVLGALSLCAPLNRTEPGSIPDDILREVRQSADRIELDMTFD